MELSLDPDKNKEQNIPLFQQQQQQQLLNQTPLFSQPLFQPAPPLFIQPQLHMFQNIENKKSLRETLSDFLNSEQVAKKPKTLEEYSGIRPLPILNLAPKFGEYFGNSTTSTSLPPTSWDDNKSVNDDINEEVNRIYFSPKQGDRDEISKAIKISNRLYTSSPDDTASEKSRNSKVFQPIIGNAEMKRLSQWRKSKQGVEVIERQQEIKKTRPQFKEKILRFVRYKYKPRKTLSMKAMKKIKEEYTGMKEVKEKKTKKTRLSHSLNYQTLSRLTRKARDQKIVSMGDGQFKVRLFKNCKNHPILETLTDARQVLDWYEETGYVGVEKVNDSLFKLYIILDGKIIHLDQVFSDARSCAEAHDLQARENRVNYRKNFKYQNPYRWLKKTFEYHPLRRSYYFRLRKSEVIQENIRLMRFTLLTMHERQEDPKEIWKGLNQLLRILPSWHKTLVSSHPMNKIYNCLESVEVAFLIGDSLIEKEIECCTQVRKNELLRKRYHFSKGIFGFVMDVFSKLKNKRRVLIRNSHLVPFQFASYIPRLMYQIILELKDEELNENFNLLLENAISSTLWKENTDILQLFGEMILKSKKESEATIREAQNYFIRSIEINNHYPRSLKSLSLTEKRLHQLNAEKFDNIQSLSQRTTQDAESDDDDDDDEDGRDSNLITTKRDVIKILVDMAINQNIPAAYYSLEDILFDDENSLIDSNTKQLKRKCLINLLVFDPTLTGGCISRIKTLWKLSKSIRQKKEFLWILVNCIEHLTQKECPSDLNHVSSQSIVLWEYFVNVLNHLPADSIRFENQSQKILWKNRFFPNLLGYFQDQFSFYNLPQDFTFEGFGKSDLKYLTALKAIVAVMTDLDENFYFEIINFFWERLC